MANKAAQHTIELRMLAVFERAIDEKWPVSRLARETGTNDRTASEFLRRKVHELTEIMLERKSGIPKGIWTTLAKCAASDRAFIDSFNGETLNKGTDWRYTHAIIRLASIAAAAQGRIPDAPSPVHSIASVSVANPGDVATEAGDN